MGEAKFKVLRRHEGDKVYEPGDERTVNEGDVKHLVDMGVLKKVSEKKPAPADAPEKDEAPRRGRPPHARPASV